MPPFRVLVIGGTGVFDRRLCELLQADSLLSVTLAARNEKEVHRLAADLGAAGIVLDWRDDLGVHLAAGRFDAVVHAAGPFQGQDYTVARLCLHHRVHYIDLADDREFVCGIEILDEEARDAGIVVCSGASTAPALTGAVVGAAIADGMRVDRAALAILPGNDAPRGRAVVEAILAGADKPIAAQSGHWGWGGLRRQRVPGLGKRWVSTCDLPEPTLFARSFGIRHTHAGAGLELTLLHVGLWSLAWLVRASLRPAARLLGWGADRLRRFGTDKGGLRIDLQGPSGNRSWTLLAEAGDGPFIPVTPAAALVRKLARGGAVVSGAGPCIGMLALDEIEEEWRRASLRIASGWGEDGTSHAPSLYRRALGAAYDTMSGAGRRLHDGSHLLWTGRCTVDGPTAYPGRLLARLFGLPPPTSDAPIEVDFTCRGGREVWTRRVGARTMISSQFIAARRPRGWLVERFGPFDFDLEVVVRDGELRLVPRGMRLLGISCPNWLWPLVKASEREEDGRFRFDVEMGLPLIGRLVRYRGWLIPR